MSILNQDIKYLKGVGEKKSKVLNKELKIYDVEDLLFYFPQKYIHVKNVILIKDIFFELENSLYVNSLFFRIRVKILSSLQIRNGSKHFLKFFATDGYDIIEIVWFSKIEYIEKIIKNNCFYIVFGKTSIYNNKIVFSHPQLSFDEASSEEIQFNKTEILPIYKLTGGIKKKGLTSEKISLIIKNLLTLEVEKNIKDNLPTVVKKEVSLIDLQTAIKFIHRPLDEKQLNMALFRLKFDEFFNLQSQILLHYTGDKKKRLGYAFKHIGNHFLNFYNKLNFPLTNSQKKVLKEIRKDLWNGKHMNRLLQGDVGCGKTIVAQLACLMAADNGYQSCIMVPTEILATQHYNNFSSLIDDKDLRIDILTSKIKGYEREKILQDLLNGRVNILIGTHSLLESNVKFQKIGLAVIDEQHRFGVSQRAILWSKGKIAPHILIMSATPIPRTLAMSLYGDLECSIIDELPPGRKEIKTYHYYLSELERIKIGLYKELNKGSQVYVVFPLVKENEKLNLLNAQNAYEEFSKFYSDFNVGLIHGKLTDYEKNRTMKLFSENKIQLLISTTVIEVGINVPNANIMVIMHAERFGLSQLHQLRGRVGRGSKQGLCCLVTSDNLNRVALLRINTLCKTNDGFVLAEEDMKLRGPGDFNGTIQSGFALNFKLANILTDYKILEKARAQVIKLMKSGYYDKDNLFNNSCRKASNTQKDFCKIS